MAQTKVKDQAQLSANVKQGVSAKGVSVPRLPDKSVSAPKRNTLTVKLPLKKGVSLLKKKYRYGHCLFCGGGYERYRSS